MTGDSDDAPGHDADADIDSDQIDNDDKDENDSDRDQEEVDLDENDKDLRTLLQQIAARAGDPPEHGLEEVSALRRRRARHRRGAVAAAVVLAVAGVATTTWLASFRDDDDVTSVADADSPLPAELPDVLELNCTPTGIDVPVASIRPQSDGLHLDVDNQLPDTTSVWVTGEDWASGRMSIEPGTRSLRQPVPPGLLTVGCRIDGEDQQRRVDLVDVEGLYSAPELACPEAEQNDLSQVLPVDPRSWSLVGATRAALNDYLRPDDEIVSPGGYPDEELADPTTDPTVRIVRDGDTVAFVHLAVPGSTGAGDTEVTTRPLQGPWSRVRLVEGCRVFLDIGQPVAPTSVASAN
jgi:hypothetical protein